MKSNSITTAQAASRLGVSPATIRRWCERGFGVRVVGRWRVPENRIAEIERSLDAACAAGTPSCDAQR